jgi:hypothetical protein
MDAGLGSAVFRAALRQPRDRAAEQAGRVKGVAFQKPGWIVFSSSR